MRKHIREVCQVIRSLGLEAIKVEYRGSGHIAVLTNIGHFYFGSSPSDANWMKHFKSHIKRAMR
jgi:hypothetical protein